MQLKQLMIDENNIAFDPAMGNSYQLGGSAKEIFQLIQEGKSKDKISKIIAQKYQIDPKDAYIDIDDFFTKLKLYGLLK